MVEGPAAAESPVGGDSESDKLRRAMEEVRVSTEVDSRSETSTGTIASSVVGNSGLETLTGAMVGGASRVFRIRVEKSKVMGAGLLYPGVGEGDKHWGRHGVKDHGQLSAMCMCGRD